MTIRKTLAAFLGCFRAPSSMSYAQAQSLLDEREMLAHRSISAMSPEDKLKHEQRLAELDALAPQAREIVALYTERNRS